MKEDKTELFLKFLRNWVFTLHPIKGKTPFPDYPFLKDTARSLTANRLVLIPKSRQMMISWIMCALTLFRVLNGGLHMLLSKNQFSADELLKRICFVFDHLPGKLNLNTLVRNRSELAIAGRGRIISLPATEDGPRMHTPTSVFWDEMAFTPNADRIWSALKPCLDNQADFTGVSTPNGSEGIYAQLVDGAPENGFKVHQVHWKMHPLRDDSWAENARKGLSEREWRREYEISFEGSSDMVYPEFTGDNILSGIHWYIPSQPLYRSIDFGYRHPFVIWLQELPSGELVVFDEWAGEDATVDQMIDAIKEIDYQHGISENRVVFTSCDPAGDAVDSQGEAPIDKLKRARFKLRYRRSQILTGIEVVKSLLRDANGDTRLLFSPKVTRIISNIRRYRWKSSGDEPEKDSISDHSMDALRYFAINYLYAPKGQILPARVRGWKS